MINLANNEIVSIIIPTYNSAKTIKRAIKSVINQSYPNWEIIIVDSFSEDRTISIVRSFVKKNIKIFFCKKKRGLAFARYYGITKSKGSYIAFLDSDDLWNKNKLLFQLNFMSLKKARFSCSEYSLINDLDNKKKFLISKKKINFDYLISNRPIALSTVILEKKYVSNIIRNYLRNGFAEDYLWWLVILKKLKYCYVLNKDLANIHISKNNRSINIIKNFYSLIQIYRNIFKMSFIKVFIIFTLLFIRTFDKNLFKYKTFFIK